MQSAETRRYATLSKLGLGAGFAVTGLVVEIGAWAAHLHVLRKILGTDSPMYGAGYWPWHIGALLFFALLAFGAGVLVAAVHNAVAARR